MEILRGVRGKNQAVVRHIGYAPQICNVSAALLN